MIDSFVAWLTAPGKWNDAVALLVVIGAVMLVAMIKHKE